MTSKGKSFCGWRVRNGGEGQLHSQDSFCVVAVLNERFVKSTLRWSCEDKIGGNRFGRALNTAVSDLAVQLESSSF